MLHEESLANAKVPHATAEGIWNKAVMLIKEENALLVASGCGPKNKLIHPILELHHIWLHNLLSKNVVISAHSSYHLQYVHILLLQLSPVVN